MRNNFKKALAALSVIAGLFISLNAQAQTGIITTVAGNGLENYYGSDQGPADSVGISPAGIAMDASGNLYIADGSANIIRKVDAVTGIITTIAGNGHPSTDVFGDNAGDGGPADSASFTPSGIAFDAFDNLYIVDIANTRIRKINAATGIITSVAGNSALDNQGNAMYSGDGGAADSASLQGPAAVAIDADGNIYIADASSNRIRKVNASTGIITTVAGNGVVDSLSMQQYSGDGGPAVSAQLYYPTDVALDASGNIYISDFANYRIRKVSAATGIITTVAGNGFVDSSSSSGGFSGDGGRADSAELNAAYGIAVDAVGNIYIADADNGRIRKVDGATGIITTIAGNGVINRYGYEGQGYTENGGRADSAEIDWPYFMLCDTSGNLYFSDAADLVVRKITFPIAVTIGPSQAVCSGTNNILYPQITNGAPPYHYHWSSNGNTLNCDTCQNPSATITQNSVFTVTVTDSLQATATASVTYHTNGHSAGLFNISNTGITCAHPDTTTVTITGGTPPFTFSWHIWDTVSGTSPQKYIYPFEGQYTIIVTDANGCQNTVEDTVLAQMAEEDFFVYINTTYSDCYAPGTISAEIFGGTPPYHYAWSNADTTEYFSTIYSGHYELTLTDSLGCTSTNYTNFSSNCNSVINGIAFVDSNSNCVLDSGEHRLQGLYFIATGPEGNSSGTYSGPDGLYSLTVPDTGNYTVWVYGQAPSCGGLIFCNNASQTVNIPALNITSSNNNFAYTNVPGFDLSMFISWYEAAPGFQKEYNIRPYNLSSTPFSGQSTVVFTYDSNLVYQYSANPQPMHDPVAHTLTWAVDTVPGYQFALNNSLQSFFMVPSNISLGYLLTSNFKIYPFDGDCNTYNNNLNFTDPVTGSFDPNEKDVQPAGNITDEDSVLTYTIHFQNTGTDSTHFIVVVDTLSPNLNPFTVHNLAASYPYSDFTATIKGVLTWTFNPYRLVDSATNPFGSKGFITFSVKQNQNLPIGATISNRASIYFDYNTPVATNTVTDTINYTTHIFEAGHETGISVKAFPNPFSSATNILVTGLNEKYDFELFDLTGRVLKQLPLIESNHFELQRNALTSGIYFYRILVRNKQIAYGKLVIE